MASQVLEFSKQLAFVPWQKTLTVQPIEQLLNAPAELQKDLARNWRDGKLAELAFVGLAVSIFAFQRWTKETE
jgi:hypothetical protein